MTSVMSPLLGHQNHHQGFAGLVYIKRGFRGIQNPRPKSGTHIGGVKETCCGREEKL